MSIPSFDLSNKVALVTGGSKGIGLGMAEALGQYGATVAINGRNPKDGEEAIKSLQEQGIEARFFQADVTSESEVTNMVEQVVEAFGRIDVLVNNAGMNIRKPLIETEEDDWDRVVGTNLKGVFLIGKAVAKQMVKQKSGKMINISSILGTIGRPNQTSYAASKGGINQLTKVWASELAPHGINVNALGPAYIKTPMTEDYLSDPEVLKGITDSTLVGRVGTLDDLVGPVVFLASDTCSYITGQTIYVDGGWTAK
ncbi:SDR family NAD(P)-dependent oxidoreductase [Desertibacillus haloalkaliphilus]|uniref:SDR family NAD(P)-dependent oxidoreductase n=1 Tax=Desertibacillus haloalkaliphilus TaxID=1328930 RepID=UPI001C2540E6|nr:glucose 1-dehydrogenase [Desertibacillus haloalkaliphilus]MBU8908926.1 glucose 1-dehydrogenase [Desertibacillus haloalkaliphilus]